MRGSPGSRDFSFVLKQRRRRILVCNGLSGPHHVTFISTSVSFPSLDVHLFTHLDLYSNNVFLSQHAALPIKNLLPRSVGGDKYRDPEDSLELGRPLNLQIQWTCRHSWNDQRNTVARCRRETWCISCGHAPVLHIEAVVLRSKSTPNRQSERATAVMRGCCE